MPTISWAIDVALWPMQWGRQVRSKPNVRAVVEFDTPRFIALFVERMERLARTRLSD